MNGYFEITEQQTGFEIDTMQDTWVVPSSDGDDDADAINIAQFDLIECNRCASTDLVIFCKTHNFVNEDREPLTICANCCKACRDLVDSFA